MRYKGIYLAGDRAVFRYDVGKAEIYDAPWIRAGADGSLQFERVVMVKPVNGKSFTMKLEDVTAKINLKELQVVNAAEQGITLEAGGLRWGAPIVTQGVVDRRRTPFAIDTITVPYKNPHQALMFTAGHDFTVNGDCYVAMAHGDVWKVTGIDAELKAVKWQRFATGLYQPLGLRVIKDQVYVLGRDQITRLHDRNQDGEADFYETFSNDIMIGGGGHSYATCLESDPEGNLYFHSLR